MTERFDINRYAEACKRAATDQGLDSLSDAAEERSDELDALEIHYAVEQTGGFTMVACFYLNRADLDRVVTCTWEGHWLVIDQPAELWHSGEYAGDFDADRITDLSHDVTTPESVVARIIERAKETA
jgi:hypothetical protein